MDNTLLYTISIIIFISQFFASTPAMAKGEKNPGSTSSAAPETAGHWGHIYKINKGKAYIRVTKEEIPRYPAKSSLLEVRRGETTVALLTVKGRSRKKQRIISHVTQMNGILNVNELLNLAVYTRQEKVVPEKAAPQQLATPKSTLASRNPTIQLAINSLKENFTTLGLNSNLQSAPEVNGFGASLSAYFPHHQSLTWLNWLGLEAELKNYHNKTIRLIRPLSERTEDVNLSGKESAIAMCLAPNLENLRLRFSSCIGQITEEEESRYEGTDAYPRFTSKVKTEGFVGQLSAFYSGLDHLRLGVSWQPKVALNLDLQDQEPDRKSTSSGTLESSALGASIGYFYFFHEAIDWMVNLEFKVNRTSNHYLHDQRSFRIEETLTEFSLGFSIL